MRTILVARTPRHASDFFFSDEYRHCSADKFPIAAPRLQAIGEASDIEIFVDGHRVGVTVDISPRLQREISGPRSVLSVETLSLYEGFDRMPFLSIPIDPVQQSIVRWLKGRRRLAPKHASVAS